MEPNKTFKMLDKLNSKMPSSREIENVMKILNEEYKKFTKPIVTEISERQRNPFKVLISAMLSLRTKDQTTAKASYSLFNAADTPEKIIKLPLKKLETLIYPAGFYKTKAGRIKDICRILIETYNSKVPDEIDELLKLKGVGRKTANLVVSLGYNKPGLCIDTHCHRIPNRWGWIKTKNPLQTEMALRKLLPEKYWKVFNDYVVAFGQNVCRPVGARCYICKLEKYCGYKHKHLEKK